jgi:hypothetical protein
MNANDLNKIIPTTNFKESQSHLRKQYTEWCLTNYQIDGQSYVTISIKHPTTDKLIYIDATGDEILYSLDTSYDAFVASKCFWYSSE